MRPIVPQLRLLNNSCARHVSRLAMLSAVDLAYQARLVAGEVGDEVTARDLAVDGTS